MSTTSSVNVFDDYEAFLGAFYDSHAGDGLPVAPPTAPRVRATLDAMGIERDLVIGTTPAGVSITGSDVATASVLAGCRPEYGPIVLAAVRAFCEGIEARTPWVADSVQAVIVNGPIRNAIQMNSTDGVLGPGWRANATIGRALRLVVVDAFGVGHAQFFGDPGQYSFCVAEDEEKTEWPTLHVDRGYALGESTATVQSAMTYKQVMSHSMSPDVVFNCLSVFLQGKASATSWYGDKELSIVLLIGHELRRRLAPTYSKDDLRDALYEKVVAEVDPPLHKVNLARPDDLVIVATGGVAFDTAWFLVAPDSKPATCQVVLP